MSSSKVSTHQSDTVFAIFGRRIPKPTQRTSHFRRSLSCQSRKQLEGLRQEVSNKLNSRSRTQISLETIATALITSTQIRPAHRVAALNINRSRRQSSTGQHRQASKNKEEKSWYSYTGSIEEGSTQERWTLQGTSREKPYGYNWCERNS